MLRIQPYPRIVTLILTLASGLIAHATSLRYLAGTDSAFYRNYSYIRFLNPGDTATISDEEFYDISARVVFPVNAYQLNPADDLLRQLANEVLPRINSDSLELASMMIRGAASPEGPYLYNKSLGERRAAALTDFIQQRLTFPADDDHFSLDIEAEDYRTLAIMMRRNGDADYRTVEQLCNRFLPTGNIALLKIELQRMRQGRLWQRLLREYFPELRVARIVLFFRKAQPKAEPMPTVVEPVVAVAEPTPAAEPITLPRRELLAVKTNLLFDLAWMPGYNRWCPLPNIAVEYYPLYGHFTYGLSVDFPWWQHYDDHKFFQVRNYQAEARYYLRSGSIDRGELPGTKAAFSGFYLQGYLHAGLYGICFDADRGWEGEGWGAGLGAGYVVPLTRNGHWRLEFSLQAGFFTTKYDPYQYENPVDPNYRDNLYYYKWTLAPDLFRRRQYRYNWIGPTRVGITLSYDLLYRRIQKRGASFYSTEVCWPEQPATQQERRTEP